VDELIVIYDAFYPRGVMSNKQGTRIKKVMKSTVMAAISPILTNNYLSPSLTERKKTTTYDVGNLGLGLGQAHKFGRIRAVNGLWL